MGNILYHYCSVESFFNILKSSCIWLSDVSKSNDYKECILCRDRVNENIEEIMSRNEEELDAWKWGFEIGLALNEDLYTYCACFSENCDQLSQWRGYADNGRGIAIGFDKEVLEELTKADKYTVAFASVIYAKEKQENYIQSIVQENFKKLENKGIGHVAMELSSNYCLKFPFIKDCSFWEEGEWRIVVSSRPGNKKRKLTDNYDLSEIKYRVADKKMVSYTEMNFEKVKKQLIREIWIGPRSEVEICDVLNFLRILGYYEGAEYNTNEPVLISKSASSYR